MRQFSSISVLNRMRCILSIRLFFFFFFFRKFCVCFVCHWIEYKFIDYQTQAESFWDFSGNITEVGKSLVQYHNVNLIIEEASGHSGAFLNVKEKMIWPKKKQQLIIAVAGKRYLISYPLSGQNPPYYQELTCIYFQIMFPITTRFKQITFLVLYCDWLGTVIWISLMACIWNPLRKLE